MGLTGSFIEAVDTLRNRGLDNKKIVETVRGSIVDQTKYATSIFLMKLLNMNRYQLNKSIFQNEDNVGATKIIVEILEKKAGITERKNWAQGKIERRKTDKGIPRKPVNKEAAGGVKYR